MLVNTDAMAMSLWAGRLLAAWLKRGIDPELGGITAPVLVLRGEQDRLVAVANARHQASRIPAADLEIVPRAGRALLMQGPETRPAPRASDAS